MRRFLSSTSPRRAFALACSVACSVACGSSHSSVSQAGSGGSSGAGSVAQAGTGNSLIVPMGDGGGSVVGSGGGAVVDPGTLPPGFTQADTFGGYKLGDPITGTDGDSGGATGSAGSISTSACGTTILAVIRDFQADGKNFEANTGDDHGLVQKQLGADRKPVFAPSGPTHTVQDPAQFDDWYRNKDGLNKAFKLEIWFGPNDKVKSFQSTAFFPIDGVGFGNDGEDGAHVMHNFHFTTEIHTEFKYNGGEQFHFTGDDDVWVFINNQLALDLGGVHVAETDTIDMEQKAGELGLTKGQVYPFDMFQNERHTTQSNFRADSDLEFVDCGTIVPEIPK